MGKATLARQRAIGAIGAARVARLEEVDLLVVDRADYDRLKTELADAKRMLRAYQLAPAELRTVAEQVMAASMGER